MLIPAILVLLVPKSGSPGSTFATRAGLALVLFVLVCIAAGEVDAIAMIVFVAFAPIVGIFLLAPGFDLLKDRIGVRNYAVAVTVAAAGVGIMFKISDKL